MLLFFVQHSEKATLWNGNRDLKKDSDKDERGNGEPEENASGKEEDSREVGENGELETADVLADAEDDENSDVRRKRGERTIRKSVPTSIHVYH